MEERPSTSPDLIRDTSEKVDLIRKHLLMAQSLQKSYADRLRRLLEFEVGDHVFLKVMPKRGVIKFGKRGKLSLRYIGPFKEEFDLEIKDKKGSDNVIAYHFSRLEKIIAEERVIRATVGMWNQ